MRPLVHPDMQNLVQAMERFLQYDEFERLRERVDADDGYLTDFYSVTEAEMRVCLAHVRMLHAGD